MFFTCLFYSTWLEIDDGFWKKICAVFLLVHTTSKSRAACPCMGQYTLFSMQCGTVWKRDKHKLIVRKETWKGQTKFELWGKRLWKKTNKKLIVRNKTCKPFSSSCCCCNKRVYNFWKRPPTNATTKCKWMLSRFWLQ